MMAEFGEKSRPLGTFSVSVYILGLALGPMSVHLHLRAVWQTMGDVRR